MIEVENRLIGEIPTLFVCQKEKRDVQSPCVIILHGVTNAKEDCLPYAYLMAEKGFKVLMPDALHHGERGLDVSDEKRWFLIFDTILNSLQELPSLKDYLVRELAVDENSIFLGGYSMGAITTFGALTRYDWIKAGFSLMGDPNYVLSAKHYYHSLDENLRGLVPPFEQLQSILERYDLTLHPEKLAGRPLFIWHGDADKVVPIQGVLHFVKNIRSTFPEQPIELVVQKGRDHKVSRKGYLKLIDWLDKQR